ncbi:hypothetical protein EDD11_008051 [Mortierella claussenii]|nr:hypothetical protein EDD11_008051 [Mortierella claussenii]
MAKAGVVSQKEIPEQHSTDHTLIPHNLEQKELTQGPATSVVEAVEASSSSSEGEDLAMLEELSRLKARLEAKVRLKQLRKASKTGANAVIPDSASDTSHMSSTLMPPNGHSAAQPTVAKHLPRTPTRKTAPQAECTISTSGSPSMDIQELSTKATTTPTKSTAPLISPGFRTPSPPPRTRFFMSPSSGSAKKRQHSPSPLPRKPWTSAQGCADLLSTPTGHRRRKHLDSTTLAPLKAPTFHSIGSAVSPNTNSSSSSSIELDSFDDLDGDLNDAFLNALLDESDFDLHASDSSTIGIDVTTTTNDGDSTSTPTRSIVSEEVETPVGRSSNYLIEAVEARKQRREADLKRQQGLKATFLTVATASGSISSAEIVRLGHAPDFDPLTGLRIKDRVTGCQDMAKMTRGLQNIPINDNDWIREHYTQRPTAGLLQPSNSRLPLTGRLDGKNTESVKDPEPRSWLVAGVVGAKSKQRTTAKKVRYCHFQLCDLKSSAINVFMFKEVMDRHYKKIQVGDVVVIMDPKVLNQAERAGVLGVEVEHPDCLVIVGKSTDFGLCEAIKLNGNSCDRILDKRGSAYCNQHIMMVTNKRRNQRGSLIAGTSSIYDVEKPSVQIPLTGLPRKIGSSSQSGHSSDRMRMMARETRETTYIFDDGGIGTSSLADPMSKKKGQEQTDGTLSSFLMSQNNPGGQYLRQAKTSKDVAWAKDLTSPKTPTGSNSELFPAEMIRRMGYDPVTGHFVPGSPKRTIDDLEARERSIRLLAERVKSPPGPMRPLSDMLLSERRRTIDVKGTTRPIAQPRASKCATFNSVTSGREVKGDVFFSKQRLVPGTLGCGPAKKWIDLEDGSDSDGNDALLSLSQQRAKNLMESKSAIKAAGAALTGTTPASSTSATTSTMILTTTLTSTSPVKRQATVSAAEDYILSKSSSLAVKEEPSNSSRSGTSPKLDTTAVPGADTLPPAPTTLDSSLNTKSTLASVLPLNKKPRFVDFSDSE